MLDKRPINFAVLADILHIKANTLYTWYRDHLSGYVEACQGNEWRQHDIIASHGEPKAVPILKPENMGEDMAIDEKMLSGDTYTVLSNRQSGKIALMAETLQAEELGDVSSHFGEAVKRVKTITCDLSPGYARYCEDTFPEAMRIADKFHIVKHALESLQAIRLRYKHQEMAAIAEGTPQARMSNGETRLEMLHRSRYVLYKLSRAWSPSQQRRAKLLFRTYPELGKAYRLIEDLRRWYEKSNIGKAPWKIAKELDRFDQKVDEAGIPELKALMKMISAHEEEITNYFRTGKTNAQAEALNNNLQRFVASNYGVRDKDFFLFRVAIYFS